LCVTFRWFEVELLTGLIRSKKNVTRIPLRLTLSQGQSDELFQERIESFLERLERRKNFEEKVFPELATKLLTKKTMTQTHMLPTADDRTHTSARGLMQFLVSKYREEISTQPR
jgi:hypothetical protein